MKNMKKYVIKYLGDNNKKINYIKNDYKIYRHIATCSRALAFIAS